MITRFKEGVGWKRKLFFNIYAYIINSAEVGVWAAAAITTTIACDVKVETVVKQDALGLACYFCPAAPLYTYVKSIDRAVAISKDVSKYTSYAYRAAACYTSPIVTLNSLGLKVFTKLGLSESMKHLCGVEECDAFYWQRPEYADRY